MLNRIDLRGTSLSWAELLSVVPRASEDVTDAMAVVEPIIADVRKRGVEALREYGLRFDGVAPQHLRVPVSRLSDALASLDPDVRAAMEEAIRRVRLFHDATVPPPVAVDIAPGARVSQRWIPVRRVGLYVPGGLAVYPSSVIMNVVAAQSAGVPSIAVVSPPQAAFDGLPHPTILAACSLLGVNEVYAVGGAQAVAMLAYGADLTGFSEAGAETCEPVDVITGPGNRFVTAAKRAVQGMVGIDAEAGPTEIAIIADANANPEFVAADLLSQAEHDPLAGSVLITDSEILADAVDSALARRAAATKHAVRVKEALTGTQSAIVLTDDLDQSIVVANAYGAEHLEIHTKDAATVAARITSAGAIFVGPYSPVPLGDYVAGSNHILPTGGTARFASGLNPTSFLKVVSVIEYDAAALAAVEGNIEALAVAEDLPAHGESVRARSE
jgi:histidinol dehydrogenase